MNAKEYREKIRKPEGRDKGGPLVKYLFRRVSWLVSYSIVTHTGITANTVSWTGTVLGVVGIALLIGSRQSVLLVTGSLLLVIQAFLDLVDGEVARFHGKCSQSGMLVDNFGHWVSDRLISAALWFCLFSQLGKVPLLYLSFFMVVLNSGTQPIRVYLRFSKPQLDEKKPLHKSGPRWISLLFSIVSSKHGVNSFLNIRILILIAMLTGFFLHTWSLAFIGILALQRSCVEIFSSIRDIHETLLSYADKG